MISPHPSPHFSKSTNLQIDLQIEALYNRFSPNRTKSSSSPIQINSNDTKSGLAVMLLENRELVLMQTTVVALLVGFIVVSVWKRSSEKKSGKDLEPPKVIDLDDYAVDDDEYEEKLKESFAFFFLAM